MFWDTYVVIFSLTEYVLNFQLVEHNLETFNQVLKAIIEHLNKAFLFSQDVYDLSHTIVERLRHKPILMTDGDTPIQYFMAPCTETSLTKRLRLYTPR